MEDEEKIYDFMVEVAWKGIESIQNSIDKIEEKATIVITFTGVLLVIISGLFVNFFTDAHIIVQISIMWELILLIVCILYAFRTIWLEKQDVLNPLETFKCLDLTDIFQAKGDFSFSLGKLRNKAKNAADDKSFYLKNSMIIFIMALIFLIYVLLTSQFII